MYITIADTSKGKRVWVQGLDRYGIQAGDRYNVDYRDDEGTIVVTFIPTGKRAVVASKGGVIDLQGKRVSQWAQDATEARVDVSGLQVVMGAPVLFIDRKGA